MSFKSSGMITFTHSGDFGNTEKFFGRVRNRNILSALNRYGKLGVRALSAATPVDTGKTAASWGYEIVQGDGGVTIHWTNSNIKDGVNIAVIIQYGHGTKNGGYVAGRNYINPAIRPVFDEIVEKVWKEVAE